MRTDYKKIAQEIYNGCGYYERRDVKFIAEQLEKTVNENCAALRAENKRMREALDNLLFTHSECPDCQVDHESSPHRKDCLIGAALKSCEGEGK